MNSRTAIILLTIGTVAALVLGGLAFFGTTADNAPTARGTTNFDSLTLSGNLNVGGTSAVTGNTDFAGTLQYGADNLYPVGFATSGQQAVYGTTGITTTGTAAHGLTTVTFCTATLGEDPGTGAGDAASVSVAVAANVCTLKAWQDDFSAATEADVAVQWLVIGAP